MIRLAVILTAAAVLHAQHPLVKRGAEIFRTTCAVAYCHGSEGTAGRAPQLAGRALNRRDVSGVILSGKPGGSMPGFSRQLKSEDLEAVTEYVLSLSRPAGAAAASAQPSGTELSPAAERGRALFFVLCAWAAAGSVMNWTAADRPLVPT
jgi:mono/diheme cytochrome c family protein